MSGKAYTMREMKSIVDYLTDNGLYNETKGRKMWTDYANSNLTTRTWQSLKETFLKRILPDITNPYYRLDTDQVLSFKRGVNLTQKDKKLKIEPVNKSIHNNGNGDNAQPSTSKNNNEENATGEDSQCSKIVHDRASTETLILDTCYQTAEDIQRDLESSEGEQDQKGRDKNKPPVKSVRDFIEYSEPLTPMLQEVLDDFATDEDCSDTEPPMQIDESYVPRDEISKTPEKAVLSQSILNTKITDNKVVDTNGAKDSVEEISNDNQIMKCNDESGKQTEETPFSQLEDVMVLVDEALTKNFVEDLNTEDIQHQDKEANSNELSSAITMTDSLLPNNQEAIKNASTVEDHSSVLPTLYVTGHEEKNDLDTNQSTSKTNSISDEEENKLILKKRSSEEPIEIVCIKEKTDENEPSHQKTDSTINLTQNTGQTLGSSSLKSPTKPTVDLNKVHEIDSESSESDKEVSSQADNPCLQSVSLYAEQLSTTKYSDSDSNNKEISRDQPKTKEGQEDKLKETEDQKQDESKTITKSAEKVILLNSRTTSESIDDSVSDRPLARSSLKKQKDKKLASVFGYSNGGAKSRRLGARKRTTSHLTVHSDSSEWTSTSDSEYVSPPHGRRNRYARKYLKPSSARIMSLEEEGGLFVMLGKKIYPLVKDGKVLKNYVTYLPESDPEEDDSYWKSKYIDERKRTAELQKKLGQVKTNGILEKERSVSLSSPTSENPPRVPPSRQESINDQEVTRRDSEVMEKTSKQGTLKIKFTKNEQEVQLEGHWQHINPVLAQVVSMFHKEPSKTKRVEPVTCVELSSGNTTPLVTPSTSVTPILASETVHEKINEMESEIFKEIEEKDERESVANKKEVQPVQENNVPAENAVVEAGQENDDNMAQVTQRRKRGRPKKEPSPAADVVQSPAKKPKKSTSKSDLEKVKEQAIEDATPNVARLTRSPRKLLDGITSDAKRTRKSTAKLQPEVPVEIKETPLTEDPDDEVRYKFPSPIPEKQASKTNSRKSSKESPKKHLHITSPDSHSHHSVNSSQGYQDSDTSPFNVSTRRKRRLSISTLSIKGKKLQRKRRSRSFPLLKHVNSDSSHSSFNISVKSTRKEQSTINSEVYRSDSYQLLMPRTRAIMQRLEKIDEASSNDTDALINKIRELRDEMRAINQPTNKNEPGSSSNLSLPLSPELSIVENLSISRSAIAISDDYPTINEIQSNTAQKSCKNKYVISEVDVSMPLMNQDCALRESYRKHLMSALSNLSDAPNSAGRNLSNNSSMRASITSESILKNMSMIDIESDSLDRRLEQLLLESTQKPVQTRVEKMEVDTVVNKKSAARKRCSTPHKKKTVQNKKKPSEEPIIEEESRAHCTRGGRRSCPPSVDIVYYENNGPDNLQINIQDESINVTAVTKSKRVKKDIIKVKIVRPKKKVEKKKSKSKTPNVSQSSGNTEGDNESGVFLQGFDDSGDLIHNHSETCLQIRDCMDDNSVEFIETETKSIISLNSSSFTTEPEKDNFNGNSMESGKITPEVFSDNAQCAAHLQDDRPTEARSVDSGNTMYFTPFMSSCNSVLTEDLSDEPAISPPFRPSKWYLLSEEESNTNYFDVQENDTRNYGANLKQLFPVTCAIPDLSTITEMSDKNENTNSQKASLDVESTPKNSLSI